MELSAKYPIRRFEGGRFVLGDGKARMLEEIDKSGSLAAGAESLHMSYRGGLRGLLRRLFPIAS